VLFSICMFLISGVFLLLWTGCSLLLQDRRGAGCGCYPGRSAGCHHDMSGSRHSANGQEERDRAQSAVRWNSRLYVGHLLWQDGNPDHQPDVRLPGICQSAFVFYCTSAWYWLDSMVASVVYWWHNGWDVGLRSRGCGFSSWSGRYQVVTTWMADCLQTGKPSRYITYTMVNSAFHFSRVKVGHVHLCQVAGNTV